MKVKVGEIVLSPMTARDIDPEEIKAALRQHKFGNPGLGTSISYTVDNHPLFGEPTKFRSLHRDENGHEFEICTYLSDGKTYVTHQ